MPKISSSVSSHSSTNEPYIKRRRAEERKEEEREEAGETRKKRREKEPFKGECNNNYVDLLAGMRLDAHVLDAGYDLLKSDPSLMQLLQSSGPVKRKRILYMLVAEAAVADMNFDKATAVKVSDIVSNHYQTAAKFMKYRSVDDRRKYLLKRLSEIYKE